jgi:hypothetical protein
MKYEVLKPCMINRVNQTAGTVVDVNPGTSLAKALLRFGQIKAVATQVTTSNAATGTTVAKKAIAEEPQTVAAPKADQSASSTTKINFSKAELLLLTNSRLREIGKTLGLVFSSDDTKSQMVEEIAAMAEQE